MAAATRLGEALSGIEHLEVQAASDAQGEAASAEAERIGELLAAACELAMGLGVDPELALRRRAEALRRRIIDEESTARR